MARFLFPLPSAPSPPDLYRSLIFPVYVSCQITLIGGITGSTDWTVQWGMPCHFQVLLLFFPVFDRSRFQVVHVGPDYL